MDSLVRSISLRFLLSKKFSPIKKQQLEWRISEAETAPNVSVPTFSSMTHRTREVPFPSALPFRRIRVTHTHTYVRAMKNREYFFYVYLVLETKINDSFSLAPDSPPPSPVPCPGELPRERRFQKLGYIRRTTVVYETSFYPRVTNHTGEKLCVHEIKVMYSVCRDGSIRNKSRNGVGGRTFVYRV